ncbi:MAG: methyltransferase domain-containing protein [Patescibacteria group bacterium]
MALTKNNLLNINLLIEKLELKQGDFVADLGCGVFGYFTFPIAKRVGKSGKVYAVDVLKDNLEAIKRRAKIDNLSQVETIWTDLEVFNATKIKNESLDVALLVNVLYQSEKVEDILRESYRMLKKNGLLLVVEWNEIDSPFNLSQSLKVKKEDLLIIAEKINFKKKEAFDAGGYHYGVLLKKQ